MTKFEKLKKTVVCDCVCLCRVCTYYYSNYRVLLCTIGRLLFRYGIWLINIIVCVQWIDTVVLHATEKWEIFTNLSYRQIIWYGIDERELQFDGLMPNYIGNLSSKWFIVVVSLQETNIFLSVFLIRWQSQSFKKSDWDCLSAAPWSTTTRWVKATV